MENERPEKIERRRAVLGGVALAGAALGLAAGAGAPRAEAGGEASIVGAWLVRWSGRTREHATVWLFLPGGVMLALDSPIAVTARLDLPADTLDYGGTGAGHWQQTAADAYDFTYVAVLHDERGSPRTIRRESGSLRYDGVSDSWQADLGLLETGFDGRVQTSRDPNPVQATRIRIER